MGRGRRNWWNFIGIWFIKRWKYRIIEKKLKGMETIWKDSLSRWRSRWRWETTVINQLDSFVTKQRARGYCFNKRTWWKPHRWRYSKSHSDVTTQKWMRERSDFICSGSSPAFKRSYLPNLEKREYCFCDRFVDSLVGVSRRVARGLV